MQFCEVLLELPATTTTLEYPKQFSIIHKLRDFPYTAFSMTLIKMLNKDATLLLDRVNQTESTLEVSRNQSKGKQKKPSLRPPSKISVLHHKYTNTRPWISTTEQKNVSWADDESDH